MAAVKNDCIQTYTQMCAVSLKVSFKCLCMNSVKCAIERNV